MLSTTTAKRTVLGSEKIFIEINKCHKATNSNKKLYNLNAKTGKKLIQIDIPIIELQRKYQEKETKYNKKK
jgi:hypothetical protein